jgi:hypothetical protein
VGGLVAVAVTAWPAAAKGRKPLVLHVASPLRLPVVGRFLDYTYDVHELDLSRLIPRRARLSRVWYVQRKDFRDSILVEWTERNKRFSHGYQTPRPFRWGLRLWTSVPTFGSARHLYNGSRWRAVDVPIVRWAPPAPNMVRIAFTDVTGDGRPDLLFEQDPMTNHGCGPHQVFATSATGVTTRVFSSYLCETTLRGEHGLLALDMPYYLRSNAVCCPSLHEHLRLGWNGTRYVTVSLRID